MRCTLQPNYVIVMARSHRPINTRQSAVRKTLTSDEMVPKTVQEFSLISNWNLNGIYTKQSRLQKNFRIPNMCLFLIFLEFVACF